jgi:hypothetical protein
VVLDPQEAHAGTISIQLLATEKTGSLQINQAPVALRLVAGQAARYSFAGTAGQQLALVTTGTFPHG